MPCFFLIFYLFIHERYREREAGSMQGTWHGTRSQVSRIMSWAEGSTKLLSHLGCPVSFFKRKISPLILTSKRLYNCMLLCHIYTHTYSYFPFSNIVFSIFPVSLSNHFLDYINVRMKYICICEKKEKNLIL